MIYCGTIVQGLQLGRTFGYPTANVALDTPKSIPANGVYAVKVGLNKQIYNGMLYVGTRPTLKMSETTIEIHLFDFNEQVYNAHITFEIVEKIREEKAFQSTEQLVNQIHQDYENIKKILGVR